MVGLCTSMDLLHTLMFPAGVIILISIMLLHCHHHALIYNYKLHRFTHTSSYCCKVYFDSFSHHVAFGEMTPHNSYVTLLAEIDISYGFFRLCDKRLSPLMQVSVQSGQGIRPSAHGGPYS